MHYARSPQPNGGAAPAAAEAATCLLLTSSPSLFFRSLDRRPLLAILFGLGPPLARSFQNRRCACCHLFTFLHNNTLPFGATPSAPALLGAMKPRAPLPSASQRSFAPTASYQRTSAPMPQQQSGKILRSLEENIIVRARSGQQRQQQQRRAAIGLLCARRLAWARAPAPAPGRPPNPQLPSQLSRRSGALKSAARPCLLSPLVGFNCDDADDWGT